MKNKKPDWIQIFAVKIAEHLHEPTDTIPSVRWLSSSTVRHLIKQVVSQLEPHPKRIENAKMVMSGLEAWDVLKLFPFEETFCKPIVHTLYRFGLTGPDEPDIREALQALYPRGTLCYFTALAFHELTLQVPPVHHIAVVAPPRQRESLPVLPLAKKSPSLGTILFRYSGVCGYLTRRDPRYLQGGQQQWYSPECIIRITSLEQSLLDTLIRPYSCGGLSVIFESWQRGSSRVDPEVLMSLMKSIGDPLLSRRAAFMLNVNGYSQDDALEGWIMEQHRMAKSQNAIPLLPAMPGGKLDKDWMLEIPQ
jgi:predicted transcriptional regulator of viral defense system